MALFLRSSLGPAGFLAMLLPAGLAAFASWCALSRYRRDRRRFDGLAATSAFEVVAPG